MASLATATYVGWLSNYLVADDWVVIGSISQPDWTLADLLPFRQVPHRINANGYYSPLWTVALWLGFKLGGFSPERYHLVTLAFHVVATLSLFAAGTQLTGSRLQAAIAASIFAVHFASTEGVGWFTGSSHVIAGSFGAAALALYARYLTTRQLPWWVVSLAALLAASLTQVAALPWFVILGCLDVYYSRRTGGTRGSGRRLAILGGLLLFMLLLQLQSVRLGGEAAYGYQLGPWVVRNLFYYPVSTVVPSLEVGSYNLARALLGAPTDREVFVALMGMTDAFGIMFASALAAVAVALLWAVGGGLARFAVVGFFLGITPFLLLNGHGYRYLYLALPFFSLAMAHAVAALYWYLRPRSRMAGVAVLAIVPLFVVLSFAESQRQLFWWQQAGLIAHKSLQQLREIQPELPQGARIVFGDLPDTLPNTNAQVWRNGVAQAVRVVYGNPTLQVDTYSGQETERLIREKLQGVPDSYGFLWENWQFRRIVP